MMFGFSSDNSIQNIAGEYSCSLLYAILRVAASASCFQYILPSMPVLDQKSNNGKSPAVSKLLCYFPEETSLKAHEMPVRYAMTFIIKYKSQY